jgi:hypothetical protein
VLIEQRAPALLRTSAGARLVLLVAAVSVAIAVVLASPVAGEATRGGVTIRLIILTVICSAPILVALVDRRMDLLSPLCLVSAAFLLLYPIRGWALQGTRVAGLDLTFRAAQAYPNYIVPTLDLAISGILAFFCGYLWRLGSDVGHAVPRPSAPVPRRDWSRAGWALMVVGLPCFLISPAIAYGRLAGTGLSEPLLNLAGLAPVGFMFLAMTRRDVDPATWRRRRWALAAVVGLMLGAGILYAHKATILWALLTAAAAYHYGFRHLRAWQVVAVFLGFGLIAFPAVQTLRAVRSEDDHPSALTALARTPDRLIHNKIGRTIPRDGGFWPIAYVKDADNSFSRRLSGTDSLLVARALTPAVHPYLNGSTYARLPSSFFPRALWPGKPALSLGPWFAVNYWGRAGADDQSAQSLGLITELYLNFGAGAVFLGMFLFGLICRGWYSYLARDWTPAAIGLYVVSLPSIIQVEGDAILLLRTGISRVAIAALGVLIVGLILTRRGRESAPVTT